MGGYSNDFDYSSIKWKEKSLERKTDVYVDEISEGISNYIKSNPDGVVANIVRANRAEIARNLRNTFAKIRDGLHHPIILCGPGTKREAAAREAELLRKRELVYGGPCGFEYIGSGPVPGFDP